ncbi:Pectinesterase catalytic, partial [Penicillium verhagenii]|uniref:Pectinesterase catalytic n=1 Tax=Penicillium verhagenii TaxID=1562060 RepID=UPI00254517A2
TQTVDPSSATSPSTTGAGAAVTVATDKSGQFTAIGDAISYAQHNDIPTVTVLAGTYPAVTVSATPSVAVIGQGKDVDDYSKNKVVVSQDSTTLDITVNVDGITFENLNFVNTGSDDPAVNIMGSKLAFYACQFISAGSVGIETGLGVGIIANSYIEAQETAIDGQATLYIFSTGIVVVADSAVVAYTTGTDSGGTLYNSTIVFDQSTVSPKPDDKSDRAYLAKAKGLGSVAVYRGSTLDGFIAESGVFVDDITQDGSNFYGEYGDKGAGAYASNKDTRSKYVKLLDDATISQFALGAVFAGAYPDFATSDTSWIDPTVLSEIEKADGTSPTTTDDGSDGSDGSGSSSPSSTSSTAPDSSSPSFVVVPSDPAKGQYTSVQTAIAALPDDGKPYTIEIKSGVYKEQVTITRDGKVTLIGETSFKNDFSKNTVTIEYNDGVPTTSNNDDKTPVIDVKDSNGKTVVALYNIDFKNTSPQKDGTSGLAAGFTGLVAAYGCSFIGYEQTLFANKGTQVLSNSYIEGSIDYIWGSSIAYLHQSFIATNTPGNSIAAQDRSSAKGTGGFVFDASVITYTTSYGTTFGKTFLGRPAGKYSTVVYMNSFLDKLISPVGWSSEGESTDDVTFAEYNNSGPGKWGDERAEFASKLTEGAAKAYSLTNFVGDTSWIDMTAYNYVPSYDLSSGTDGASPAAPGSAANPSGTDGASPTDDDDPATGTSTTTPSGTSASSPSGTGTAGHPASGTKPPTGAVLVSVSGTVDNSFSSLTAALKSLPSDDSVQIIFIYSGTYNEKVPSIDRPGPTKIIGYTKGNPGQSYSDNTVTITFSSGVSSPSDSSSAGDPSNTSDSDTATISTISIKIAFYNIDIVNSDNSDGSKASYADVAASISGSKNAFYACSFMGWEETLLTNGATTLQYYESSYIEGAVDSISGPATAYFKGCTLGAKMKGGAFTAQNRPSKDAGGYVFDQCLFEKAPSSTADLTGSVFLGRPGSEYALVVVKMSYLTDVINPSGWTEWSSTDPRTDHVTFAEFKNTGPGNWENNAAARKALGYATLLTSDTYTLGDVMDSTDWIDMTYFDSITTPTPKGGDDTPSPGSPSATTDSTTPPDGAFIVSKTSIAGKTTYDMIGSALDALPTSQTSSSTIFIYPGTYDEQIKVTNPGTVILVGYSESPTDNEKNQVTIENNKAGDPTSDSSLIDSATLLSAGGNLQVLNINVANTNGGENDASVALAVASAKYASIYACRVIGSRNALVVNGFFFAANSYIEGSMDMISGGGAGYFLNSTISPSDDDISITADKRASSSTPGGLVFDQSKVTPVGGAGAMVEISLGRPQNSNARVAYIDTHLGSCIEPKGWEKWSDASPRTDGVLFGEFGNDGPGSDTSRRVSFATKLDKTSVVQFEIANFFDSLSWIDFTHVVGKPFSADPDSASSSADPSGTGGSTSTAPADGSGSSTSSPDSASSAADPSGTGGSASTAPPDGSGSSTSSPDSASSAADPSGTGGSASTAPADGSGSSTSSPDSASSAADPSGTGGSASTAPADGSGSSTSSPDSASSAADPSGTGGSASTAPADGSGSSTSSPDSASSAADPSGTGGSASTAPPDGAGSSSSSSGSGSSSTDASGNGGPASTTPTDGSGSSPSSTDPAGSGGSSTTDSADPDEPDASPAASSATNSITTSTIVVTTTTSTTVTDAKATSTKTETNTLGPDSTITPPPVIEISTQDGQSTVTETETSADSTKTVQSTMTVTNTVNEASQKATYTRIVTITTTITSTPQPSKTTTTITSGAGDTVTKTGKATTSTTTVTSGTTKTESTTTTVTCIPARKMKRSLLPPRSNPATKLAHPTQNTTEAVITVMAFSHPLERGRSITTTSIRHDKVTISFVTSTATKTNTATVTADTATVTVTKIAGDPVTLDPETSTTTVNSLSPTTSTTTVTTSVQTTTDITTTTVDSMVGPAPSTVILVVETEVATATVSLPAATSTKTETTTDTNAPSATVTSTPTSTKTKTVTTTATTTSTVTSTAKDATTCTS